MTYAIALANIRSEIEQKLTHSHREFAVAGRALADAERILIELSAHPVEDWHHADMLTDLIIALECVRDTMLDVFSGILVTCATVHAYRTLACPLPPNEPIDKPNESIVN